MAIRDLLPITSRPFGRPLQPFDDLHKEIERLFGEFSSRLPIHKDGNGAGFMPEVEVHEDENEIRIAAELPGVEEKDIDVSVTDQVLTISGEKKQENEVKDGDYYRSERSYGAFRRSMSLPFDVEEGAVDARFVKGVLTVTVPKPANLEGKTRKIAVKSV
ncbi:MAG: Hsp20/alpha crystallin family protein [Pseudomonadota bacterium]